MKVTVKIIEQDFQKYRLATQEDVIESAGRIRDFWMGNPEGSTGLFCRHASEITEEFIDVAKGKIIFPAPEGGWTYSVVMRGSGLYLELCHYTKYDADSDEQYILFKVKAPVVTPEEYAQAHGISHQAVVSRVRRGKIRCACKIGQEWRIPVLAEPIERGYQATTYHWDGRLAGLHEKYKVLENYCRVDFFQDRETMALYHVRMTDTGGKSVEFTCPREQRSKIEQALISHPDVYCSTDQILRISFKDQEVRLQKG